MKRLLFLLTLCTAALCASAKSVYVTPNGTGNGTSWANALGSINSALGECAVGDEVLVAQGTYKQQVSPANGVAIKGGYNAETGERDINKYVSIIDGTDYNSYLINKSTTYSDPVLIEGFTVQNVNNGAWGTGTLFLRSNMTINRCTFRNCKSTSGEGAGAIFLENNDGKPNRPVISNCIFELCEGNYGAAIYNNGDATIENCIFRGCKGKRAVVRNKSTNAIIRNCLFHNNTIIEASAKGAIENGGIVINCTVCNNYSSEYAGIYTSSSGKTYNCIFWGNKSAAGFNDKTNYLSSSSTAEGNIADEGTSSSKFITVSLPADNFAADGPNFGNPTAFVGAPTTESEILAMQYADFSLTEKSTVLIDKGTSTQAPATDIAGEIRPIGNGIDIGAYEYNPAAAEVPVEGIIFVQDTMVIAYDASQAVAVLFKPANATNKQLVWSIDDESVATVNNGLVSGVKVGKTVVRAKTPDEAYKDTAVVIIRTRIYPNEVLEADKLKIEDYTIPSFIEFLVAKKEARLDSLDYTPEEQEAIFTPRLAALKEKQDALIGKEEPYNQIATFNGDPKTHMGFCWFTNGDITDGVVQLVSKANATAEDFETCDCLMTLTADATTTIPLHYTPIQATESPKYDICTAAGLPRSTRFTYVSHKALAENLTPGQTYSWRVGYAGHWSEIGQFCTQEDNQGDFSFVYMTDSHIHNALYISSANQSARSVAKNAADAKFCLFPGDFVETGDSDAPDDEDTNSEWQWERWFEGAMRPALQAMPFVPTGGNHDVSDNRNYDYHFNTDHNFFEIATTKPQFHGVTYSFQYGDVLFLVYSVEDWWHAPGSSEQNMTSTYLSNDVRNWFKSEIAKYPNAKYRVTVAHKNLFSGADHYLDSDAPLLRAMMLPVLKECEIDLAIQGHDHCYEVIGPVNPDTWTVVEGSVTDTVRVKPEGTNKDNTEDYKNMTGLEGGTFTTDEGTLYFIGATCGEKRYGPKPRATYESQYTEDRSKWFDWQHHNVKNYFDLFTSKFGQPKTPSYSRFNVTDNGIEVITYKTDADGNTEVFNTINVRRTKPHTMPTGYEETIQPVIREGKKFIRNGQVFIQRDGKTYNMLGEIVK